VFPVFSSDGWGGSNRFSKKGDAKERKDLKTRNSTLSKHECRMASALEWSNGDEVLQDWDIICM